MQNQNQDTQKLHKLMFYSSVLSRKTELTQMMIKLPDINRNIFEAIPILGDLIFQPNGNYSREELLKRSRDIADEYLLESRKFIPGYQESHMQMWHVAFQRLKNPVTLAKRSWL